MKKESFSKNACKLLMALMFMLAPWAARFKKQLISELTCIAHKVLRVTNHRPHKGGQWQRTSMLDIAVSCRAFDGCPLSQEPMPPHGLGPEPWQECNFMPATIGVCHVH